ncbi:hypothetical protein F4780DRAFT_781764 [Xylariomycetidae sp. FL0641]|nr:hypothetical protein F4780DRAFT_781764 [Xylariomycetidae sp. FL0641]
MPPQKQTRGVANPKRGQPTSAARVITSSYAKYGWSKALTGEVKKTVEGVRTAADAMLALQQQRARPVSSFSLRNALFWEHRSQLAADPRLVSTPAADHLDFFSADAASYQDTMGRVARRRREADPDEAEDSNPATLQLHYFFQGVREREFLLWPVALERDGPWVTIILRLREAKRGDMAKSEEGQHDPLDYVDREVTDLAIIDPLEDGRLERRRVIEARLPRLLAEGCVGLADDRTVHQVEVPGAEAEWQTGLLAYAVAREFLRRLKVLLWRRRRDGKKGGPPPGAAGTAFLWEAFEEHANVDGYREAMMAACAHQTIEKSGFLVRMALEVPSETSGYAPEDMRPPPPPPPPHHAEPADEKYEAFQLPTHTLAVALPGPWRPRAGRDEEDEVRPSIEADDHHTDESSISDADAGIEVAYGRAADRSRHSNEPFVRDEDEPAKSRSASPAAAAKQEPETVAEPRANEPAATYATHTGIVHSPEPMTEEEEEEDDDEGIYIKTPPSQSPQSPGSPPRAPVAPMSPGIPGLGPKREPSSSPPPPAAGIKREPSPSPAPYDPEKPAAADAADASPYDPTRPTDGLPLPDVSASTTASAALAAMEDHHHHQYTAATDDAGDDLPSYEDVVNVEEDDADLFGGEVYPTAGQKRALEEDDGEEMPEAKVPRYEE